MNSFGLKRKVWELLIFKKNQVRRGRNSISDSNHVGCVPISVPD